MIHLKILFFATLRDRAGTSRVELELPKDATVTDLKAKLVEQYPSLTPSLSTVLVAVNHDYAFGDMQLKDGDEVALFPPVSGG
jgi:molybdopterin converting factor subunit 1